MVLKQKGITVKSGNYLGAYYDGIYFSNSVTAGVSGAIPPGVMFLCSDSTCPIGWEKVTTIGGDRYLRFNAVSNENAVKEGENIGATEHRHNFSDIYSVRDDTLNTRIWDNWYWPSSYNETPNVQYESKTFIVCKKK